jgi:hypothetical protein
MPASTAWTNVWTGWNNSCKSTSKVEARRDPSDGRS